MAIEKTEDFYAAYAAFKGYETPNLRAKHIAWYDREIWRPARCSPSMSVLELGSGTGEFLAYLQHKGVDDFLGVEQDQGAVDVLGPGLKDHVHVGDLWDFLDNVPGGKTYDRVVMLDVLEHFGGVEGAQLLEKIKGALAPGGKVAARVPNMGSPWGGAHQYGDLTHKAAYNAASLEQLGKATGYEVLGFFPYRRGSPARRFTEDILHWILSKTLSVNPIVWTANIIVVWQLPEI